MYNNRSYRAGSLNPYRINRPLELLFEDINGFLEKLDAQHKESKTDKGGANS